jgi:hypothetical protein
MKWVVLARRMRRFPVPGDGGSRSEFPHRIAMLRFEIGQRDEIEIKVEGEQEFRPA